MAAAPDPDEVLRSTDENANFQRLVRLLISGGTSLLRETFDAIHPPSNLPTVLSNPATKIQLKAAKLTKPQWDCLYPSPGVYGKSTDFDVTLLFRLLRTITSLTPPATGWDAEPASTDHSLTADLARIKYHRNSVYGHVNQKMEIPDDQFLRLWQEISKALVRIAAQISREKKTAWQEAIDDYRKDPLTADDERNVKELERWYQNDMDVKKTVEELKTTTQEGIEHLKSLKTSLKDFQDEFEETSRMMARGAQCLETAVREEAQDIKDKLKEIHHVLMDSVARSRSTGVVQLQNDYEDTEGPGTQGRASGTSIIHQVPQAVVQGTTVALISLNQPQALITTGIGGENVGHRSIPSAQDVLSTVAFKYVQSVDLSKPEEFIAYLEYMEKMRTMLFDHGESGEAKKILKELWKNYCTGQVNEMAETFLVAENFLKKHGLIDEYTACRQGVLKSPVVQLQNDNEDTEGPGTQGKALGNPQEPQAVVQGATVSLISLNQPQALITSVTYPASMGKDVDAGNMPENQESLNFIRKQFAQLHRLRVELHNAVLQRTRIIEKVDQKKTLFQVVLFIPILNIFLPVIVIEEVKKAERESYQTIGEIRCQLFRLEEFIYEMASEIFKSWYKDPVLIRQLEGSDSDFGARFFPAATFAATTSSSADATTIAVKRSAAFLRKLMEPIPITVVLFSGAFSPERRIWIPSEEEIQGFVESFIEEKFTDAYKNLCFAVR